ncbi:MAG: 4-hydroxy-tetrahydrodipicolinate synthase [candidate division NC10 bacterium]|nr:4-hydroxy-tetrahydrodipicolinate synthase [candidate division NC10 bacterium]MCZ6551107.1 4-hydroxy-tetrahydrodipicolinate synthase [candidate division NC10 bacterium]
MKKSFHGSIVAMVTPFRDGQVDEAKIRELVEFHVKNGTDAIVPCGTTGESPTLSHEEHKKVVEVTIAAAAGRVPVVAGTGSNSTAEAIALTQHAKKAGADGVLMVCPYYNKPTQKGLIAHYKAVAEAVDIPIIMYNIPGRTGVNMLPDTVATLAELQNIVGMKEASGSLEQMTEVISLCGEQITVVSGDDTLTLPLMVVGGKGVISVIANILPKETAELTHAALNGDWKRAKELHLRLFPLCKAMFYETNPGPVKTAMQILGRINGELRLPLAPMSEANREKLQKALKAYGLLS